MGSVSVPIRVALACCTVLAATFTALAASSGPAGAIGPSATWTQLSPATAPSAREGASMAYDPATGTVVLFGGINGSGDLSDTWTWDGNTWTQLFPATSPSARHGASMAYDPATGNMVLFGGYGGGSYSDPNPSYSTRIWTWDGTTWTRDPTLEEDGPPQRYDASMAYDPATGNMVLFGGMTSDGYDSGTWIWNGANWYLVTYQFPPARYGASMDYDPATGNMVLFGGYGGSYLSDTWTWDGTTWTQQSPATSPPDRYLASMAYDPAAGSMVLFGGYHFAPYSDTWTWDGTTWTQQSPAASPSGREDASMAYDPATSNMVLFGGYNGSYFSNTWIYQLTPTTPTISNLPASGTYGGGLTATVATNGDGTRSVTSSTPSVCTPSGLTVTYIGVGTCTLIAHVADGSEYAAADGSPQSFSVGQATPTITSFSPVSGPVGTMVTIKGTNLSGATKVTFNGVKGTITSDTATKIKVKVPSGATTGKIKVVTPGGRVTTATSFTVT